MIASNRTTSMPCEDDLRRLLEQRVSLAPMGRRKNPFTGGDLIFTRDTYYPAGASESLIEEVEKAIGVSLRDDFRKWLMISNGPLGFLGIGRGEREGVEGVLSILRWLVEKQWLPISRDMFGNFFVLPEDGGPVWYVEATIGDLEYAVASNLFRFVQFNLEKMIGEYTGEDTGWPSERLFFAERDPELLRSGHRMIWDN